MRRRELERRRSALGWNLLRHGGNHDVWTDGERQEYAPRHAEVNELLARRMLAKAATKQGSE